MSMNVPTLTRFAAWLEPEWNYLASGTRGQRLAKVQAIPVLTCEFAVSVAWVVTILQKTVATRVAVIRKRSRRVKGTISTSCARLRQSNSCLYLSDSMPRKGAFKLGRHTEIAAIPTLQHSAAKLDVSSVDCHWSNFRAGPVQESTVRMA